ncbi:MAG: hypothetical protein WCJ25_01910 [Candidatus Moraniibacteriota bacterium]
MKRIFIISASLFGVTLLFLGVYNLAFRSNPSNPTVDAKKQAESKQVADKLFTENAKVSAISPVTDVPVYGPVAIDDSHITYFNNRSLKRASLGGGGEEVLIKDLPGKILQAIWSPDKTKALVLFGTDSGEQWFLLTLTDGSVKPLKPGIASPTWSNLSERIFYLYSDPSGKKTEIDSAKPDGTDWKTLSPIAIRNAVLAAVPSSATLSFWNAPSAFEETSLSTVPVSGGDTTKIFSGKFGTDYSWSPDGTKILISNTISKGGSEVRLGIANQNGGEFRTVQAPTIISKTVWSKDGKTVYYALPLSIPENAVLPNDYFSRPIHTQDSFWKMDVTTGKSDRLVDPSKIDGGYDSIDLFLDQNETYLYFTDRTSGKLYRIQLGS